MERYNLVDGWNCTAQAIQGFPDDLFTQEQRMYGAVLLHIFFVLHLFYGLAIVCDEYFIPPVEQFAKQFNMPSDIAGATVMGIANSMPEFSMNLVGTFTGQIDLGFGTVVGSSVFNILFVGGSIGLFTPHVVPVSCWSISRDSLFYLLSLVVVARTLLAQEIQLQDAIALLALYILYIVVICFNKPLRKCARRVIKSRSKNVTIGTTVSPTGIIQNQSPTAIDAQTPSVVSDYDDGERVPSPEVDEDGLKRVSLFRLSSSRTFTALADFVMGWPFRFLFKCTIPDCRTRAWRKWYFVTLVMSLVWITGLCYVVSWMSTIIGFTFGIPDTVMGLVFIAIGTSVTQVVGSVIVAKHGLGTMAMNNAISSTIFDVLIAMGLPWLIHILMSNQPIAVRTNSMIYSILMLLASIVVVYAALALNNFKFDKKIGIIIFLAYIVTMVVGSLFETNIILNVNLPTCPLQ